MNRPKPSNRTVQAWVTLLFLLLACGGVGEYMPMGTGSWWEYSTEVYETVGAIVIEDYRDLRYAEITFQEESETHGRVSLFTKVMDDVGTSYSYYMSTQGGALTTYQDIESPSGEEYLREPIETGTSWLTHSRHDPDIPVRGEILDESEGLSMSLWTFEDCVHVRLISSRELEELYPGPETVTWDFWFAKGIGIVRSVLVNENPAWQYRRTVTQELLNYSIE